jgi:acetyl esterase/lipase
MRKAVWTAVLLCTVIPAPSQEVETFTPSISDVVYAEATGQELALDVYLPKATAAAIPALIYVHGGGWQSGDKSAVPEFLRKSLLDAGIALISVNYRFSTSDSFPAQAEDVTRAVQFVRWLAKDWGLREDRIALMGTSAGGHLALWVGLHDDQADPKSKDPVERRSSRVAAIVNYYGPTNFHLLKTIRHTDPAYLQLFGLDPGESASMVADERLAAASPITYVSPDDPPVFTFHGLDDQTVPVEHARELAAKLMESNVPCEEFLLEQGVHDYKQTRPGWPDFQQATIDFLKKNLLGTEAGHPQAGAE